MFILDSHCDTPTQIIRGRDIALDNRDAHVDFPKLRRGGVDACFFALYTPNTITEDESLRQALKMLAAVRDALAANPSQAALATTPEEAFALKERGLTAIFLGMENALPLGKDLSLLRFFYREGVRYVTLTHNGDNEICDSAAEGKRWGGVSPFGREFVAEMNRIGMLVDIAHCSDQTFYDCIETSTAPIVSTHSCCRALCNHRRNLTDEQLRALAGKGGVCQINFYPVFLSPDYNEELDLNRPGIEAVVDHIDHAVNVAGIDAVGIGSDFDGIDEAPLGLDDISRISLVFDEMARRGYSEGQIEKVAGLNFLRVLSDVAQTKLL